MSTIHLVMTAKGGVGKSFIATILAQYLMQKAGNHSAVFCADTDPSNPTFSSYKELSVQHYDIMTPSMNIDKSKFDLMIEKLLDHPGDSVIDNGASSFLPMMAYIMENDVVDFLVSAGKKVVFHAVLVGGIGLPETMRGLDALAKTKMAPILVWENELHGPVERNGKKTIDTEVFTDHSDLLIGIVNIIAREPDTFGKDVSQMTSKRWTFAQAIASTDFNIMARSRLTKVQKAINTQLDAIDFEVA